MATGISNFSLVDRVASVLSPLSSDEVEQRIKQAQSTLSDLISSGNHEGIDAFFSQNHPRAVIERLAKEPFDAGPKETLLHCAANSTPEVMRTLLKFLPEAVNTPDRYGNTPLMHAARSNNVEVVNVLLQANASVDEKNENGWTALIWAAFSGAVDVVKTLLGYAAATPMAVDVNAVNNEGNTAFMLALRRGHVEAATALKEGGVATDIKNNTGRTALMMAASAGRNGAAAIALLKPTLDDLNQVDEEGYDALRLAIENSSEDRVGRLLELGANPNAKTQRGDTPLLYAIQIGATGHIQTLLKDQNIDLNAIDKNGRTALIAAARSRDWPLVDQLIDAGADYNVRDKEGMSMLNYISVEDYHIDVYADRFKQLDASKANKS